MPTSYFEYKYPKTARKLTMFLLIVLIASLLFGYFFPNYIKRNKKGSETKTPNEVRVVKDSLP